MTDVALKDRWPHIRKWLRIKGEDSHGDVDGWLRNTTDPSAQSAGYEEWADFYEWLLAERSTELAGDRVRRYLVQQWTDDMVYLCRRCAMWARGENPGEWVLQHLRRPDLDAEGRAIAAGRVPSTL